MRSRRICVGEGPCIDRHVTVGGFSGRPPLALWAVRDADGDVGCISGQPGRPPALDVGETILGCYEYDVATDAYTWRPTAPDRRAPNPYPGAYPENRRHPS
ncbi:MAG: hypothetical protein WKG32_00600 [Gemmatimonadaceae bacterium]